MTVGVLYPSSNAHPDAGADFTDGLRVFLKNQLPGNTIQLLLEGIGFGGAEKEVYSKAEKLLRIEKANILVAFIDLRVLPLLEPMVYSLGKLLIVANSGANYPYNWVPQPNILFLSLHHSFLCYLTGLLAGATPPYGTAIATTYYDCGYLHTASMVNGLVQQGGAVTFNFIHPQGYDNFDISPLTTFLAANESTRKIGCIFDELPASLLYQQLTVQQEAAGLQLFVSPMMLEEKALAGLTEESSFSVQGYRPWQPGDGGQNNQSFTTAFQLSAKKEASIFALLGWETGLLLQQVLQQNNEEEWDGATLIDTLKNTSWQSPRGTTHLDEETHYVLTPAVKYTMVQNNVATEIISPDTIKEQWAAFTAKPAEGISSGWTNTYLCY